MLLKKTVSLQDVVKKASEIEAAVRDGTLSLTVPTSATDDKDFRELTVNEKAVGYTIVQTDGA